MAWTKQVNETQTAKTGNTDIEARFFFGDASATPPSTLRVEFTVLADILPGGVKRMTHEQAVAATSLSGAERTQLNQLLAKLRDDALAALGFVNTP